MVNDTVCIQNDSTCVGNFSFISATEVKQLAGLDGIIGLAPDGLEDGTQNSFVRALKEAGIIDHEMIALNLTSGEITFG